MSKIHAIAGLLIVAMLLSACGAPAAPVTGTGTDTSAATSPAPDLPALAAAAGGALAAHDPGAGRLDALLRS